MAVQIVTTAGVLLQIELLIFSLFLQRNMHYCKYETVDLHWAGYTKPGAPDWPE